MILMNAPRCSGKTTWALRQAEKHDAIIVCHSQETAKRLGAQAKLRNFKIKDPIYWSKFIEITSRIRTEQKYIIDEIEMCLMYNASIHGMTTTSRINDEQVMYPGETKEW